MLIRFGSDQVRILEVGGLAPRIEIPLPVLGESEFETVLPHEGESSRSPHFTMWKKSGLVFGVATETIDEGAVESVSYSIYKELFGLLDGRTLYRIWNYAPKINEGEGDNETYKLFCKGRSVAFHEQFGANDEAFMPSGSCLGAKGDRLIVYFLAGLAKPSHYENPQQIPAYRYPRKYGPKSPSFARATSVLLDDIYYRFVSGTAAVVGSESIGVGDLSKQLAVTCENLQIVERQSRVDIPARASEGAEISGKVYLRRAEDYEVTRDYLAKHLPQWSQSLVYLQGDICRRELLVEVELNFRNEFL